MPAAKSRNGTTQHDAAAKPVMMPPSDNQVAPLAGCFNVARALRSGLVRSDSIVIVCAFGSAYRDPRPRSRYRVKQVHSHEFGRRYEDRWPVDWRAVETERRQYRDHPLLREDRRDAGSGP